jgi:hypothetical protein
MGLNKKEARMHDPSFPLPSLLAEVSIYVQRLPDPGQEEATDATLFLDLPGLALVAEVLPTGAGALAALLSDQLERRNLLFLPCNAGDREPVVALTWRTFTEVMAAARAGLAAQQVLTGDDAPDDEETDSLLALAAELETVE